MTKNIYDFNQLTIFNNTVYNNNERGFHTKSDGVHTVRNNISWANAHNDLIDGSATESNDILNNSGKDPQFISTDSANANFLKLSSTSTNAIDQGFDLSGTVDDDYFGNSRPRYSQATPSVDDDYDIGAHEDTIEAPQNLRIISQ